MKAITVYDRNLHAYGYVGDEVGQDNGDYVVLRGSDILARFSRYEGHHIDFVEPPAESVE